jgi:hypothetical protein
MFSTENIFAARETPFALSGLECVVHCHHGVIGPFFLETPFKSAYCVDMVYEFLGHHTEEKIVGV